MLVVFETVTPIVVVVVFSAIAVELNVTGARHIELNCNLRYLGKAYHNKPARGKHEQINLLRS